MTANQAADRHPDVFADFDNMPNVTKVTDHRTLANACAIEDAAYHNSAGSDFRPRSHNDTGQMWEIALPAVCTTISIDSFNANYCVITHDCAFLNPSAAMNDTLSSDDGAFIDTRFRMNYCLRTDSRCWMDPKRAFNDITDGDSISL